MWVTHLKPTQELLTNVVCMQLCNSRCAFKRILLALHNSLLCSKDKALSLDNLSSMGIDASCAAKPQHRDLHKVTAVPDPVFN